MARKLFALMLVAAFTAVLAACGGDDPTPTPKPVQKTAAPAAKAPAAKAAPAKKAPAAKPAPKKEAPKAKAAPAAPKAPAVSFKGETIRVISPYSPGGGYDAYSRFMAKYLGKYLPGNPKTVVQNRPGGGGVIGSNFMYNAKPDGLTIGIFPTDLVSNQLIGQEGVQFDFQQFRYLGSLSKATKACFVRTDTGVKTLDDLIGTGKKVYVGSSGSGGDMVFSKLLINELKAGIEIVLGYQGTADTHIAVEAGEIDGRCTTWSTVPASNPQWIEDNFVTAIIQFTLDAPDPQLPNAPMITPYKDKFSDIGWNSLLAAMLPLQTYRPFVLPKGTPDDIAVTFQAAFQKVIEDPDFIADLKLAKRPFDPQSGAAVEKALGSINVTPDVVENMKKLLGVK